MRTHRTTAILALPAAIPCGVSPSFGRNRSGIAKEPRPTITLRVVNEAGVKDRTLARAGKEATAIFGRSGVDLVFLSCRAGRADWSSDKNRQAPAHLAPHVMAFAHVSGGPMRKSPFFFRGCSSRVAPAHNKSSILSVFQKKEKTTCPT